MRARTAPAHSTSKKLPQFRFAIVCTNKRSLARQLARKKPEPLIDVKFKYLDIGRKTGYGSIRYHPGGRYASESAYLLWWEFFPYSRLRVSDGLGIGTLAHVSTLLESIRILGLGPETKVYHGDPSERRQGILDVMGCCSGQMLEEYLARSIEFAATQGYAFPNPFKIAHAGPRCIEHSHYDQVELRGSMPLRLTALHWLLGQLALPVGHPEKLVVGVASSASELIYEHILCNLARLADTYLILNRHFPLSEPDLARFGYSPNGNGLGQTTADALNAIFSSEQDPYKRAAKIAVYEFENFSLE